MGQYINYSPWNDAANYGRGFGQTLAQALLTAPAEKRRQERENQRFPLEQELLKAQIQSALSQPELRKMMYEAAMGRVQNDAQRIGDTKKFHDQQYDINGQRIGLGYDRLDQRSQYDDARVKNDADRISLGRQRAETDSAYKSVQEALMELNGEKVQKQIDTMGQPKLGQPDTQIKRAMETQMLLGETLPGGSNATPVSANAAVYAAGEQQKDPTQSMMSILQKILQPNVETNAHTFMHPFTGEVVTNGGKFVVPGRPKPLVKGQPVPVAQQPMVNAPAPMVPHGMVRVKAPNGQTGQIPAEQVDEALASGYQVLE